MRLSIALCCLAFVLGCAGPPSTGALWAQQNLEREAALDRIGDAQRAQQARAFELGVADEALASERARIEAALQTCPGDVPRPLTISVGDRVRDAVRLHLEDDAPRTATVARLALADWRLRRAEATGRAQFCGDARSALDGDTELASPDNPRLLGDLPLATVTRDPRHANAPLTTDPAGITLSRYVLGATDTVRAAAPLPQYLALVYGGSLVPPTTAPALSQEAAADMVDRAATAYPAWEPDALYAALRGGQP
ncbi:MAG TPA: hypothetical protein VF937_11650 [Chloroflexota bacterium]